MNIQMAALIETINAGDCGVGSSGRSISVTAFNRWANPEVATISPTTTCWATPTAETATLALATK